MASRSICCRTTALPMRWSIRGSSESQPLTSAALHARPLWDILADYGVGVRHRQLAADAAGARRAAATSSAIASTRPPARRCGSADPQAGDPTTAIAIAREAFDAWQSRPWQEVLPAARARRAGAGRRSGGRAGIAPTRGGGGARGAVRAASHGGATTRARSLRPCLPARRAAGAVRQRPAQRSASLGAGSLLRASSTTKSAG